MPPPGRMNDLSGVRSFWHSSMVRSRTRDLLVADPDHALPRRFGWRGELAAEIEQLVLHLAQDLIEPARLGDAARASLQARTMPSTEFSSSMVP